MPHPIVSCWAFDAPVLVTFCFFSIPSVTGELSLGIALSIYNAEHVEFLGFKHLQYVDTDAFLENMPALCYTSALEKYMPVRKRFVKDPESCSKSHYVHVVF